MTDIQDLPVFCRFSCPLANRYSDASARVRQSVASFCLCCCVALFTSFKPTCVPLKRGALTKSAIRATAEDDDDVECALFRDRIKHAGASFATQNRPLPSKRCASCLTSAIKTSAPREMRARDSVPSTVFLRSVVRQRLPRPVKPVKLYCFLSQPAPP